MLERQLRAVEDVRFHHIDPGLWVLEARRSARKWVVFHETYTFCLILRNDGDAPVPWRYNHRIYTASRRRCMVMEPGELHANVTCSPVGDFFVVQISAPLMKRVAHELGWPFAGLHVRHPHPGSDHPAMLGALRRFYRGLCKGLFAPPPRGGQCRCAESVHRHRENLAELVCAFIENCAENARDVVLPERGAAQIPRAIEYLRAHYNEPYSLGRVARAAGCDPYYLAHQFTKQMGISPSAFQHRLLVAKACSALALAPRKPLDRIARDIGWPSRPNPEAIEVADKATLMIRHFRRTLGTTPGEFRASLRAMAARARH
jgi:AraC-like DNA-binding protein